MRDEAQLTALLERTGQHDHAAFRELFDLTSAMMMGIALRVLQRKDLAEDALQEAYINVWEQASRFDPARGSARGWITAIVRRRAIDRLRASPWLEREVPDLMDMATYVDALPASLTLRQCLHKLDARTYGLICLAYLYGMTHQELSDATGMPLGTTKSRLRRGLAALKTCLQL